MTFDGVRKGYFVTLRGKRRPPWAPLEHTLIEVPGMAGAHLGEIKKKPLPLEIPALIESANFAELKALEEDLADWLVTKEPRPLVFDDEPNRTYYAILDGSTDIERFVRVGIGMINFICPDPYRYGPEYQGPLNDTTLVSNNGNEEADPIFTFTANKSTTFAMISNGDDYMMVGKPYDIEQQPFEPYQSRYRTDGNTLVGWTNANDSDIDGGIVAGNLISRSGRFVAESYGTGTNWHGPAMKTSLTTPVKDFRLTASVSLFNGSNGKTVGRVEIYLLDENGNAVCKMSLKDTSSNRSAIAAEMRAGDRDDNDMIISGFADRETGWNNFSGELRISREWDDTKNENVWSAYVGLVDGSTGRHHTRRIVNEWRDKGRHNRNVAQIVVHVGAVGTHTIVGANSGVSSISLHEIVKEPEGIPFIAHDGDEIVFNHKTRDCFINGEPTSFDFGADFFKLDKGYNNLAILPEETFDATVSFRERYK